MTGDDIRELDRRAVLASVDAVAAVTGADLERPTPCAGWTVRDLLGHMIGQHDGFAAAAAGRGGDLAAWAPRPLGDDPAAEYAVAAERVIGAFAAPGTLDRRFAIPEISPSLTFPAAQAISFHFVDYVVHGWDMARALGVGYRLDADLAAAAVPVAEAVPDSGRLRPGAAFAPRLAVQPDMPALDRVLALLGRSPSWPQGAG